MLAQLSAGKRAPIRGYRRLVSSPALVFEHQDDRPAPHGARTAARHEMQHTPPSASVWSVSQFPIASGGASWHSLGPENGSSRLSICILCPYRIPLQVYRTHYEGIYYLRHPPATALSGLPRSPHTTRWRHVNGHTRKANAAVDDRVSPSKTYVEDAEHVVDARGVWEVDSTSHSWLT